MKAFLASLVLLAVITVGAYVALDSLNMSAKQVYTSQTGSVRLDPDS